jgi:hypothetical protein
VRQAVRRKPQSAAKSKERITELRRDVANLTDAIAQGLLRGSNSIAQRLVAAEAELHRLESASRPAPVTQIMPDVRERFLALLTRLDTLIVPRRSPRPRAEDRRADHVAGLARVEGAPPAHHPGPGRVGEIPLGRFPRRPDAAESNCRRPVGKNGSGGALCAVPSLSAARPREVISQASRLGADTPAGSDHNA